MTSKTQNMKRCERGCGKLTNSNICKECEDNMEVQAIEAMKHFPKENETKK